MTRKIFGMATVALVAGTMSANAGLIDFTDDSVALSSSAYTVFGFRNGNPTPVNRAEPLGAPVALTNGGELVGDNDGIGIRDDEITTTERVLEWVTIEFTKTRRLTAVYFLDLFLSPDGLPPFEEARVAVGGSPVMPADASIIGAEAFAPGELGLGELEGLSLVGDTFTFWVALSNDNVGDADAALAAINVAPVPLPASVLFLGVALGGLGLMRRKTKA